MMKDLTSTQKFKAFLFSYSGAIAGIGIFLMGLLIAGPLFITNRNSNAYRVFDDILSPIIMSVIASAIFYFLSYYWPNVRRNKVVAEEINHYFRRLEKLNQYSLVSIGLGSYSFYKEGEFKHPRYDEIKTLSEGIILKKKPFTDCWKEDKIYPQIKDSITWTDYFTVIVNEQHRIFADISKKVNLHPAVRKEILRLKDSFSLYSYLELLLQLENQDISEDLRTPSQDLQCLILFFCDHIDNLIKIENKYRQSVYQPL